ncbi:MAG TPA: exodeoxyribonuclease III [Bacteroidales bacterium]|nr:exodeoxyribonuclease III [Bacteroidales bacterium]
MKIISFNLNGIRSAISKGLYEWLESEKPDVLCVQEIKALPEQIDVIKFKELGYNSYIHSAQKPGYSGVAVFSKSVPDLVKPGIGIPEFDKEGRLLRLDFGNLTIINSYFPSGTTGDVRQEVKMAYLGAIQTFIDNLKKDRPNIILSGDYNICHKEIDINNPQNKKGVSGFLPEEREWVTKFLESGFIDSFRVFDQGANKYSWWSYRAGARAKNLGWRIDYHMVSNFLKDKLKNASILSEINMSDHCPVVVEIA